jgi:shikimate kinase / 3-dehydroquinate synthase
MSTPRQIVLVGLSGVGKSSVGRELAERLGWALVDTDDLVRERTGQTPAQLIVAKGEPAFRDIEASAVLEAVTREPAVIATGGGAYLRPANRRALAERGLVCFLDAPPAEIAQRLRAAPEASDRPLLGEDIEARLGELDVERRGYYGHADLWIPCLGMTPAEVATRIVQRWAIDGERLMTLPSRLERVSAPGPAIGPAAIVDTGTERYPIWVGAGERRRLPERMKMLGLLGRVFLISDANVIEQHGASIAEALDSAGIPGASYVIPPGEASKSLRVAQEVYSWLASERAERRDVIVALGGGVVGDLAGYVAATYLRGMPVIQVPTSVLAMNDAAIGGKVAVDLPAGKNLVGAFHQPAAVISDVEVLTTLPRRSYLEGFAEVIKHAFILDGDLLTLLEYHSRALAAAEADPALLAAIIGRSSRLKALVVSADPQERGLRAILNYGHTIGHGIETAAGLGKYLHGEAVSVGLAGAARIGTRMGVTPEDVAGRLNELLHAFDLPLTAPAIDHNAVLAAMRMDKKVSGGRMRFVLLEGIGRPVLRDDVEPALVEDVVRGLVAN